MGTKRLSQGKLINSVTQIREWGYLVTSMTERWWGGGGGVTSLKFSMTSFMISCSNSSRGPTFSHDIFKSLHCPYFCKFIKIAKSFCKSLRE